MVNKKSFTFERASKMNYDKRKAYYKEGFLDDQNCDICGLQKFQIDHEDLTVTKSETKKSFCLIKSQIAHLHEQILGCTEYDKNTKPRFALSIDNEFFRTETFQELQKQHKQLLKVFFDPGAYETKSLSNFKPVDNVRFFYVETIQELHVMFDELLKQKEIAVNLEYYTRRSYSGFTWLLQISTESSYYMINCLKLQKDLYILNTIFLDIKILKIFHDGENAVYRLYNDFGILVMNMFDTAILQKIIMESKKNKSLQKNINFQTSKIHTHFLIFLKTYLINFSIELHKKKFLKTMRQSCRKMCEKVYKRVNMNKMNFKKLLADKATNRERYLATELLKWRDRIAQKEDESPNFILPDNDIFKIARELLHRNTETLSKCYGAKFMSNEETCLNVNELVLKAKKLSNKGKNYLWFLNKQYQLYMEDKLNSRSSKIKKEFVKDTEVMKVRKIQPVKSASKNLPVSRTQTISEVKVLTEQSLLKILKPQICFKDSANNHSPIWKPQITTKPNALEPLNLYLEHHGSKLRYCHPYKTELENFVVPRSQLYKQKPIEFKKLDETTLYIIETESQLHSMLNDLKQCIEIAIDLKYNKERSYSGYTCVLLISTRNSDYIIDALSLRSELHILNEIFTNPNVLKVFHNSIKKMIWLQKDFSLYIVNMFDIARTNAVVDKKKVLSLPYLKKQICQLSCKKVNEVEVSTAEKDWRVRPFSFRVKNYLRSSTHYLLYIKDILSNELYVYSNLLKRFYEYCTDLCKNLYCKPFYQIKSYKHILDKRFVKIKYAGHTARIRVIKELHKLRYHIAQKEDENPQFVMEDDILLKLVDFLPKDEQKIVDLWNYDKARIYLPTVKEIICSARNLRISLKNSNDDQCIYETENQIKDIKCKKRRPAQQYINHKRPDKRQLFNVTLADFLYSNKAVENGVIHLEKRNDHSQIKEQKSKYKMKNDASFIIVKGKYWNNNQTVGDWLENWIDIPWPGNFELKPMKENKWQITLGSKKYSNNIWNKRCLIHYLEGTLINRVLTAKDQKIQKSLINIGKELEARGLQVKIRDLGIKIEDKWYEWKAEGGLQEISEEEAWKKGIDVDL